MHLKSFSPFLTLALLAGGAVAAEPAPMSVSANGVVTPSTPAPVVAPMAAPAPNQIVYTPRLPSAAELTSAASAQGLAVERIEQSATQVVAVYKTSSGQINVVSYQALPPAGTSAPAPAMTTSPAPTVVYQQPAPTVIYDQAPRTVYYYDDPLYYPRIWYPPVSVSLGFGFGHRFGGGFHGRWR